MNADDISHRWASHFGLALTPLFEAEMPEAEGAHAVLLDGGHGSFALSCSNSDIWKQEQTADWAWSSDLPHHITVTEKVVAVTRWDKQTAELLSRSSVETRLDAFYSYLIADRVRSTQRVTDHVLGIFRRVRSLAHSTGLPDEKSIDVFLAFFSDLVNRDRGRTHPSTQGAMLSTPNQVELLNALPQSGIEALIEDIRAQRGVSHSLRLFPSLAVRHASSEIFQEAHFELLRAPPLDLFSYAGPAETKLATRGGTHFTPAALARSIVEQTLAQVENLSSREHLSILDPACGSGAFLHEALRALRRLGFGGRIIVIGRDISEAAVSMARFVLRYAADDWSPEPGIEIDILTADSLSVALPEADVILMNPPFVAWSALDDSQRDAMRQVLGRRLQGRGDLSMAFVTRAVDLLTPGGALGAIFPSSLLTLQAAEAWRADLMDRADMRLLASLGDYGLFSYALVQVAAAILAKPSSAGVHRGSITALVTTNSAEATGDALRTLRRVGEDASVIGNDDAWRLFRVSTTTLRSRPTWRLTSPRSEEALSRLADAGIPRLAELFDIRQGVRTGDNKAFLLTQQEHSELPAKEKRFFRPALVNDSISDGRIEEACWVFYPYSKVEPLISTETELKKSVPTYFKRFLAPKQESLAMRSSLTRDNREDWWSLSWPRTSWAFDTTPRLVSKYFGGPGGFAVDIKARFVVVQGFAWFPKPILRQESDEDSSVPFSLEDLLCAYAGLMNSRRFGEMLEIFSPHVAGGQFDLSPRYVDQIPVPNLMDLSKDERIGRLVFKLAEFGRDPRLADVEWRSSVDRITGDLYGGDFFEKV